VAGSKSESRTNSLTNKQPTERQASLQNVYSNDKEKGTMIRENDTVKHK